MATVAAGAQMFDLRFPDGPRIGGDGAAVRIGVPDLPAGHDVDGARMCTFCAAGAGGVTAASGIPERFEGRPGH